jgi:hypothetical protein
MKTLLTDVGLAAWSSLVVLAADNIWLLHDIINNGISWQYMLIHVLFVIGYGGLAYSLYKHDQKINKTRGDTYYTDDSGHCGD